MSGLHFDRPIPVTLKPVKLNNSKQAMTESSHRPRTSHDIVWLISGQAQNSSALSFAHVLRSKAESRDIHGDRLMVGFCRTCSPHQKLPCSHQTPVVEDLLQESNKTRLFLCCWHTHQHPRKICKLLCTSMLQPSLKAGTN